MLASGVAALWAGKLFVSHPARKDHTDTVGRNRKMGKRRVPGATHASGAA